MKTSSKRTALLCAFFGLVLAVGFFLCIGAAFAAEQDGGGGERTIWETLQQASWVGFIILLVSIAAVALIITFSIHLRRDELVPPDLLDHVGELFENESYDEALEVCENNPSWLSTTLAAGLRRVGSQYEEIEKSMREASEEEEDKLTQRVGYLSLIGNIAPMLGLFGTVLGMIKAFNEIAESRTQPKPADLADGISMALVTTFLGLLVAIPVTACYVFFRNKVVNSGLEIREVTEELMERFRKS